MVAGTLKVFIPPRKKPWRKVHLYQKGDFDSMRRDSSNFAKDKYFNGHSGSRSVQENFNLITSRVRTRISFSFATIFANLIFFVPFSLTLSQILSHFSPMNYLVRKKVFIY